MPGAAEFARQRTANARQNTHPFSVDFLTISDRTPATSNVGAEQKDHGQQDHVLHQRRQEAQRARISLNRVKPQRQVLTGERDSQASFVAAFDTDSENADETISSHMSIVSGPHSKASDQPQSTSHAVPKQELSEDDFVSDEDITQMLDGKALDALYHQLTAQVQTDVHDVFRSQADSYPPTTIGEVEEQSEADLRIGGSGTAEAEAPASFDREAVNMVAVSGRLQNAPVRIPRSVLNGRNVADDTLHERPPHFAAGPAQKSAVNTYPFGVLSSQISNDARNPAGSSAVEPNNRSGTTNAERRQTQQRHDFRKESDITRDIHNVGPDQEPHVTHDMTPQEDAGLDHGEEQLRQMPFEVLRQESFDFDPSTPPFAIPDHVRDSSIGSKLEHLQGAPMHDQTSFFNSLPLDEWEHAGDWFLDRFQQLIGRFRDARREKRGVARDVEERMYERHQYVIERKRKLEGALMDMRATGERVIETPASSKKRRAG